MASPQKGQSWIFPWPDVQRLLSFDIFRVHYLCILLFCLAKKSESCLGANVEVVCLLSVRTPIELNTLRPRQNGRHFADEIFKRILFNENVWISLTISLKFVPKVRINNFPALVPIMVWCRPGDKPISEATMACLLTHICVTRPQWVKRFQCCCSTALPDEKISRLNRRRKQLLLKLYFKYTLGYIKHL